MTSPTATETKETVTSETEKDDLATGGDIRDETRELDKNEDEKDQDDSGVVPATTLATQEPKDTPTSDERNDTELQIKKNDDPSEDTNDSEAKGSDTHEKEAAAGNNEVMTSPSKASTGGDKVKVHFVAVGSAPIMKRTKFQIGADQRFASVTTFLRKMLKLPGSGSSLFLYCNSAFVPAPDEFVGDLSDCFSIRGELVIHYSLQDAWG